MKVLVISGGIGGLATALSLHAVGLECEVFEQSRGIRDLGVGLNLLPHAIKELAALGLLHARDRVAIRTYELRYTNRFGQELWHERRGRDAGYDDPQLSIHRGKLQGVLYAATRARIGEDPMHTAYQLHDVVQDDHGVTATFIRRDGSEATVTAHGDVLIAAEGMHSTVRRLLYPEEGPPTWNGIMLWRGAVEYPPFLTGRSMLIAGGMQAKLVLYPISNQTSRPGTTLLNWAVAVTLGDGSAPPPRREDWNRATPTGRWPNWRGSPMTRSTRSGASPRRPTSPRRRRCAGGHARSMRPTRPFAPAGPLTRRRVPSPPRHRRRRPPPRPWSHPHGEGWPSG
jgi:2-polyprenyl-6-methoxyphenol hydroxylase-like FAD-dependent oxidoreductase